jgi:septal ring factor EnvC (AmiA/AmiB activator)
VHRKYISELEEAGERLEDLLKDLAAQKKKSRDAGVVERGFSARKGTLSPPVKGRVVRKFGKFHDEKFKTFQFHKGIDIAAEYSHSVKAVYDGNVVFSGWFRGFGQMIILDHGGGYYTLAANNQELLKRTGDAVMEGEVIGRLPSRLEAGGEVRPRLYFEVRERANSVDPLLWLARSALSR